MFRALATYIPLGIIGVWRWSFWMIRLIGAALYRPSKAVTIDRPRLKVSVVTPVYNEDHGLFEKAMGSWIANGVDEVVAVIDKTNVRHIANYERAYVRQNHGHTKCRLVVTAKPGKRAALCDGINRASGDIIALVDSDTVWDEHVIATSLPYFANAKIGAVTVAQRISNPNTVSNVLFDMLLWNRYHEEVPFLLGMGRAFNTLSGRTALYRREALLNDTHDNLHHLRHEFFLGTRGVSGDDKRLTHLILKQGWHVGYAKGATVYTQGLNKIRIFMKQRLRWTRNSWRADLRAINQGWVFKHPALAYFMLDRFIQPFLMLLGPIAFIVALFHGEWVIAGTLAAWWTISRLIKLFSYFRHYPKRLIYLPAYIFYTYANAVMKIYALGTLLEHSWATRGHKKRKGKTRKVVLVSSGLAVTALVLLALANFITTLRHEAAASITTPAPVASGSFLLSTADSASIAAGQKRVPASIQPQDVKQYIIQPGDTLTDIAAKTCLSVQDLKRVNNLPSINHVDAGQVLFYYCIADTPGEPQ
jgi:cellulose synthase/poly-beta-1,6-N-acetylglucosamine synthase-like glycosyltransferase